MTGRDEFDQDDAQRALLAGADPARSLSPADPAALRHLLEDVMSTDLETRPAEPAALPVRRRTRTTWLVAAAAAAVIAGVGGLAVTSLGDDDDREAPSAGAKTDSGRGELTPSSPGDSGLPAPGTTSLGYAEPVGRCAYPTEELIAAQQQAFAGTVTAIDDGTVTITTTEVYAGEVAQTVEVAAPTPDLRALISAADFQVGQSYLVSASDEMVAPCGLTGKATGDLQSLYEKAFVR